MLPPNNLHESEPLLLTTTADEGHRRQYASIEIDNAIPTRSEEFSATTIFIRKRHWNKTWFWVLFVVILSAIVYLSDWNAAAIEDLSNDMNEVSIPLLGRSKKKVTVVQVVKIRLRKKRKHKKKKKRHDPTMDLDDKQQREAWQYFLKKYMKHVEKKRETKRQKKKSMPRTKLR